MQKEKKETNLNLQRRILHCLSIPRSTSGKPWERTGHGKSYDRIFAELSDYEHPDFEENLTQSLHLLQQMGKIELQGDFWQKK